ncbi:hypothetical protein [Nocardioides halotolerans]|uniref:hypothetical protein n=1 Tax=Nocardioides halotolerans TaxID=433660 RepID=UPI0003F5D35D|nr:hypothetical protein [Nocardioides halotolerans]
MTIIQAPHPPSRVEPTVHASLGGRCAGGSFLVVGRVDLGPVSAGPEVHRDVADHGRTA